MTKTYNVLLHEIIYKQDLKASRIKKKKKTSSDIEL